MRSTIPVPLTLLAACVAATPPTSRPASQPAAVDRTERRTFELSPVPPPVPALRYQFIIDAADVQAGNGAMAYLEAGGCVSDDVGRTVDAAMDADERGDRAGFDRSARLLLAKPSRAVELADYAGRCDQCDWGITPGRLRAGMWPELGTLRSLANLLACRARYEARAGRVDDAVADLRRAFELGRRAGEGATLVNGLVGVGTVGLAATEVAELMNRPDGPNLYWALAGLRPSPVSFARSIRGERAFVAAVYPVLAKGRTGGITAEDWRAYVVQSTAYAASFHVDFAGGAASAPPSPPTDLDVQLGAVALMPQSVAYWSRTRHVSVQVASKVPPPLLAATYVIEGAAVISDEAYKLLGLPYPQLLPRWRAVPDQLRQSGDWSANPMMVTLPSLLRAVVQYARVDRRLAALTAVEAVRSYAAGHGGALPNALSDVTDTPVPDNPVTGRPFEWHVERGVGTLGDHDPLLADRPLEYTVHIRNP